jgi:hypothetical protein
MIVGINVGTINKTWDGGRWWWQGPQPGIDGRVSWFRAAFGGWWMHIWYRVRR